MMHFERSSSELGCFSGLRARLYASTDRHTPCATDRPLEMVSSRRRRLLNQIEAIQNNEELGTVSLPALLNSTDDLVETPLTPAPASPDPTLDTPTTEQNTTQQLQQGFEQTIIQTSPEHVHSEAPISTPVFIALCVIGCALLSLIIAIVGQFRIHRTKQNDTTITSSTGTAPMSAQQRHSIRARASKSMTPQQQSQLQHQRHSRMQLPEIHNATHFQVKNKQRQKKQHSVKTWPPNRDANADTLAQTRQTMSNHDIEMEEFNSAKHAQTPTLDASLALQQPSIQPASPTQPLSSQSDGSVSPTYVTESHLLEHLQLASDTQIRVSHIQPAPS